MRSTPRTLALLAALLLAVPLSVGADEAQIVPVTAFRDVTVIVSVTDGDVSDSQGGALTSEEQGAYDEAWDLEVSIPTAVATGQGTQVSEIGPSGLSAAATLGTSASAVVGGAASVIATNEFQTTFTTLGPLQYTLTGSLSAGGDGRCTLILLGQDVDVSYEVTDDTVPLDLSGTLSSGAYVLLAKIEGDVNVNLPVDDTLEATGGFTFDLAVCAATPLERRSWGEVKNVYRDAGPRD